MLDEQLEFAISQYADGTLPAEQRAALEARLRLDPEAAATLAQYRALDQTLRELGRPQVRWQRLAEHLSSTVADAHEQPARSYRSPWVRRLAPLAAAAAVLIVLGIVIRLALSPSAELSVAGDDSAASSAAVVVQGPQPEAPSGPQIAKIKIGPSPAVANSRWHAAGTVVSRPSRVIWIASGNDAAQDSRQLPY